MAKKHRIYKARLVAGKIMLPADLVRLHKYMLEIEHIDHISDEMRAVVEELWPELARFQAFESAARGGVSVAAAQIDGTTSGASFREIAAFEPFDGSAGTRVATTSTTTGANLLVSGVAAEGTNASVLKYELVRPNAQSTTLQAVRLGQVWSGKASQPAILGGD